MAKREVIVIGAGVSGLAAAYALSKGPDAPRITVLEASDRLGGKIASNDIAGRIVDAGPDALLVRDPEVKALLEELGLADRITAPGARGAFVWTRNKLRALPPATLFGVPEKLRPLVSSGLISWRGLIRIWPNGTATRKNINLEGSYLPSSSAEMTSDEVLAKRTPLKKRLATHSDRAVIPHWMKKPVRLASKAPARPANAPPSAKQIRR